MAGSFSRLFTLTAALLSALLLVSIGYSQDKAEKNMDQEVKQRMLEREAANALNRLKIRLEKEGFYSGRVALNVWRSTALDAGTFDPQKYNEFKRQLYQKSINDSLKCFEEFILDDDFYDANICLQTWRMHSKELGTYAQTEYEALKKRLADAKAAKASGAKSSEKTPE